jgi:hypothetical protein
MTISWVGSELPVTDRNERMPSLDLRLFNPVCRLQSFAGVAVLAVLAQTFGGRLPRRRDSCRDDGAGMPARTALSPAAGDRDADFQRYVANDFAALQFERVQFAADGFTV